MRYAGPFTWSWSTLSTALDASRVPTMAADEEIAVQQRHGTIANGKPIYGLLFDGRRFAKSGRRLLWIMPLGAAL